MGCSPSVLPGTGDHSHFHLGGCLQPKVNVEEPGHDPCYAWIHSTKQHGHPRSPIPGGRGLGDEATNLTPKHLIGQHEDLNRKALPLELSAAQPIPSNFATSLHEQSLLTSSVVAAFEDTLIYAQLMAHATSFMLSLDPDKDLESLADYTIDVARKASGLSSQTIVKFQPRG